MSVSKDFESFCSNLEMSDDTISKIQSRYHRVLQRINIDYWYMHSDSLHGLYVGSYGRGTEIWTSDIDILIQLPHKTYEKFDKYSYNGQSALLQEVKTVLQRTYSSSHLRGDGQVVCINFSDNITFEIVPAFLNKDSSYTYPDTHDGGSWKITDPKSEIDAMNQRNSTSNKNLKRLCRMMRAWKEKCAAPMNGILIDTLAYQFIDGWEYKDKSYLYYDYMSRDFFSYLKDIDEDKDYWLAPGSHRHVGKVGNFQTAANRAYNKAIAAIEDDLNGYSYSSRQKWREIYGSKFPE